MNVDILDSVCDLAKDENDLREILTEAYFKLKNIVKTEDNINSAFNSINAPRHLNLLNEISKELKKESYIPNCIDNDKIKTQQIKI